MSHRSIRACLPIIGIPSFSMALNAACFSRKSINANLELQLKELVPIYNADRYPLERFFSPRTRISNICPQHEKISKSAFSVMSS